MVHFFTQPFSGTCCSNIFLLFHVFCVSFGRVFIVRCSRWAPQQFSIHENPCSIQTQFETNKKYRTLFKHRKWYNIKVQLHCVHNMHWYLLYLEFICLAKSNVVMVFEPKWHNTIDLNSVLLRYFVHILLQILNVLLRWIFV